MTAIAILLLSVVHLSAQVFVGSHKDESNIPDRIKVGQNAAGVLLDDTLHNSLKEESGLMGDSSRVSRKRRGMEVSDRIRNFKPEPYKATWLAVVLPGAGQIYNRKYWKLPIVYGGFMGCLYAYNWNNQMYSDYRQAFLDIMDADPNTKSYEKMLPLGYDITGKEERFKTIFKNKKNYFRKYRDMSIFAFAGVYLLAVVDAYVDAELSSFDVSRDLSLSWGPTVIRQSPQGGLMQRQTALGIQCNITF